MERKRKSRKGKEKETTHNDDDEEDGEDDKDDEEQNAAPHAETDQMEEGEDEKIDVEDLLQQLRDIEHGNLEGDDPADFFDELATMTPEAVENFKAEVKAVSTALKKVSAQEPSSL